MATFAQEFARNKGQPIQYGDRTLVLSYVMAVERGDIVRLVFDHYVKSPVQGIRVSAREKSCFLESAGERSRDFVFWTDTAPREVSLKVAKGTNGCHLVIWNVWRDEKHGTTMYGLNNAAI